MDTWARELSRAIEHAADPQALFGVIDAASRSLGFEHSAVGTRLATPVSQPRTLIMSSQPRAWQARYASAGYLELDPTVRHGALSESPQIWTDRLFREVPALWDEAKSAGLRHGWAQSSLDAVGLGSMISLSRSSEPITAAEFASKRLRIEQLCHVAHLGLRHRLCPRVDSATRLTERERDVLRWAADGATSSQTASALRVSADTVNFHVKNATLKLGTAGKTATVVRALLLHLLD